MTRLVYMLLTRRIEITSSALSLEYGLYYHNRRQPELPEELVWFISHGSRSERKLVCDCCALRGSHQLLYRVLQVAVTKVLRQGGLRNLRRAEL